MRRRAPALLLLALLAGCAGSPAAAGGTATVRLGGTARLGAVRVTPLEVVEDSRCPTNVVCIQAGAVRVRARVDAAGGARSEVLTLGQPVPAGAATLALTAACPHPVAGFPIEARDRRFTFSTAPAAGAAGGC